jgi:acyl carrier protein
MDVRLQRTIAQALRLEAAMVTPELALGAVERWDSLGHLRLVLAVEQAFNVRFAAEEIPQLTTVALIEAALKAKGVAPSA